MFGVMAAVDIDTPVDTACNDKDKPPTDEKYPLVVHYCGGLWSFCDVCDLITNFS